MIIIFLFLNLNQLIKKIKMTKEYINRLLRNGNLKNGKGLSGNSVNIIINVIQSSLRMANILEYSQYYYADKIQRPRVKEKAIDCFNIIEQKKLKRKF